MWSPARFPASSHALGRGRFDPASAAWTGDGLRLTLPAGRRDGAEVASVDRYAGGVFRARLRAADAPGSLTAFFLYEGVPGERNDEVDVEIFNDATRRLWLTTWADGERTHHAGHALPFDPRAALHEYAIEWRPGEVARFSVDGREMESWTAGIPTRPMKLLASAWWPAWMDGGVIEEDRFALVESIEVDEERT
jgi:endo-1,3-1,4-beta-glycanase ExoK